MKYPNYQTSESLRAGMTAAILCTVVWLGGALALLASFGAPA